MSPFVDLIFDGDIARLTLKRAAKLNALDMPMIHALSQAALDIDAHPSARVAILSGDEKALKADIWTPSPEVVGVAEVLRAPLDRWVRQARLARAGLKPELAAALYKDQTEERG